MYDVARLIIELAAIQPKVDGVLIEQITAWVNNCQLTVDVEEVSGQLKNDYDGSKTRSLINKIVDDARKKTNTVYIISEEA